MFCTQPFNRIEIFANGNVFTCCPEYINNYSIGNIYETPFKDIWNGERAKSIRKKILQGDYTICNDICNLKNNNCTNEKYFSETVEEYPSEVSISSDCTCNVRCRICRDEYQHSTYNKEDLEEEINTIWIPIFKNAKILKFGISGEPFASLKEKMIIKKAQEVYPDIKFHFHTNGILGNEKLLRELNVYNKTEIMTVSLHSASRWTYNRVVVGGNWDKVLSNLKLYSQMKRDNLLHQFRMIFVVYSENYKDIPKFVKLAKKYNAKAEFWALMKNDFNEIGRNFDKYSIINENHKYHKNLIKILKDPILQSENVVLYPVLNQLIQK